MAGTHREVDSVPQEQLLNGECGTAGARLAQRAAGRGVVVRAERREAQAGRLLLCRDAEETSGHVAGSPCRRMDCQVWLQHAWPLNRLCTHKVTPSAACLHTGAAALSAGVTGHQKLTK